MKRKWYAEKGGHSTGGAVKTNPKLLDQIRTPKDEEAATARYVCFLQKQQDERLNKSRRDLIALLPELVGAAETLNSFALDLTNSPPAVRLAVRKANKIIRKASALLANEPEDQND